MNNSLKEDLENTYKKFDVAIEIYEKVYDLAAAFTDRKTKYNEMINLTTLASNKVEALKSREEYISVCMANILQISESIRV